MRRLWAIASLVIVALALVAAGCGGSNDESPAATPVDEWADGFCGAVTTWTDALDEIRQGTGDSSALSLDTLRQAGEDAGEATDALVQDLRDLGAPDTQSGDEIDRSLEAFADQLETESDDLSAAIEDVESLSDLPRAISAIGATLTTMGARFESVLQSLADADIGGEIESALEDSAACDQLEG